MKPKKTLNLAVPRELLDEFNGVCANYGHGKQKGMVLSAAILMFMRADPHAQGQYIQEVMAADIAQGVKNMLAEKVAAAKKSTRNAPAKPSSTPAMPRKAAKKAGDAVRSIKQLPNIDDFTPPDSKPQK